MQCPHLSLLTSCLVHIFLFAFDELQQLSQVLSSSQPLSLYTLMIRPAIRVAPRQGRREREGEERRREKEKEREYGWIHGA